MQAPATIAVFRGPERFDAALNFRERMSEPPNPKGAFLHALTQALRNPNTSLSEVLSAFEQHPGSCGNVVQGVNGLLSELGMASMENRQRILVIEDSEDIREALKEFLEDLGHEVDVAESGLEGTAKLLEMRPDVALVDVGLPGIDGYEVARRVRAEPGGDSLYLVALTGYGGTDARVKAEQAGFDRLLTKPVDIDDLPRVLVRDA